MGLYEESERIVRRAVGLNANDSRTLAEVGWRLAVKGKFDEGMPLMQEAIDRSADPPGWYFHLLAIDQLLKGDYTAMGPLAERAALSGGRMSQALLAIAASATEDREATVAALSRIPSTWDAEAFFRRHGATEEIVDALLEGLDTASASQRKRDESEVSPRDADPVGRHDRWLRAKTIAPRLDHARLTFPRG